MSETAIKVEGLTKLYKLYDKASDRFKESLGLTKKKCYREHFALRDIDLEVKKGETVGIIGTNGSGKSTILKIITGVLNPTSGNVMINGKISALLELGAGFNMEYTGVENVYLNGTMIGFTKEEIDAKLRDILDFADIGDFVNQPVKTYSSGMFVRLAFAVAINIDPDILIVDEALSVGDVFFQAKCYRKFEEFKKLGKTILFVSHDLGSISKYCDRTVLLNNGVKLGEGSTKDIIDMYKKVLVNQQDASGNLFETGHSILDGAIDGKSWKSRMVIDEAYNQYGNGLAEIVDFCVVDDEGAITNNIIKNHEFIIKMKVEFHAVVEDPIFAFTIKDKQGTEICGTNTMIEKIDIDVAKPGDLISVSFKQNMNLQGTDYLLSFGCTGYREGDFTVYHRIYDVFNITVISDKNTVGFFDMNSEITVKKAK